MLINIFYGAVIFFVCIIPNCIYPRCAGIHEGIGARTKFLNACMLVNNKTSWAPDKIYKHLKYSCVHSVLHKIIPAEFS